MNERQGLTQSYEDARKSAKKALKAWQDLHERLDRFQKILQDFEMANLPPKDERCSSFDPQWARFSTPPSEDLRCVMPKHDGDQHHGYYGTDMRRYDWKDPE